MRKPPKGSWVACYHVLLFVSKRQAKHKSLPIGMVSCLACRALVGSGVASELSEHTLFGGCWKYHPSNILVSVSAWLGAFTLAELSEVNAWESRITQRFRAFSAGFVHICYCLSLTTGLPDERNSRLAASRSLGSCCIPQWWDSGKSEKAFGSSLKPRAVWAKELVLLALHHV